MNFKTHFIFSTFAVNEQKVHLYAQSATKNAIFGAFLPYFPPKTETQRTGSDQLLQPLP